MAITQAVCTSFKSELLQAVHNFAAVGGNTFKLALYTSSATLDSSTTAYTTSNETTGTGYTAGGQTLTNLGVTVSGTTAYIDFSDVTWTSSTISAAGALIYNSSASNKSVLVLNFGGTYSSTNGDFTIQFPAPGAATAILTLS